MKRIYWIDDLKGLLISLIVAGHVVATLSSMTTGSAKLCTDFVFKYLYTFHIPFFFMIAGITLSPPDSNCYCLTNFRSFIKRRFFRIMVPYYFWGGICAVIYIMLGQRVSSEMQALATSGSFAERTVLDAWYVPFISLLHAGCWPNGQGFRFNGVLWFLPMLFICHVIYFWLVKLVKSAAGVFLIFTLCLFYMANLTKYIFDMNLPFDFTRVPIHMAFLALGHWIGCLMFYEQKKSKMDIIYYVNALFLIGYVIMARYYSISLSKEYAAYSLNIILKAIPSIFIIMIVAKCGLLRRFSVLAPFSIGIMLFHKYPLVMAQLIIGRLHCSWLNQSLPCMMIGMCLTLVLIGLCYFISTFFNRVIPWSLGGRIVVFKKGI